MSDAHIHFDADHVPESERHNPHAHTDFDWPSIFESLDGEIDEIRGELTNEELTKLGSAMARLLGWCLRVRDTQGRGFAVGVGGRCIALVATVVPRAAGESQSEVAARLGISKQAISATFAEARAHVRRLKRARG